MSFNKLEFIKKYGLIALQNREELRLCINRSITESLKIGRGTNFKKKIPLVELIYYKVNDDDKRFQSYVVLVESINEYINRYFPYIELDGIDLNWTCEELTHECYRQYDEHMELISKLSRPKLQILDRLKEEEN